MEPVTNVRRLALSLHERLLDQLGQRVSHAIFAWIHADCLRSLQCESAGEDAEGAEKSLLWLANKLVAPIQACPHLLVAGHGGTNATLQDAEAAAKTLGDLRGRKRADARSRQLDREGNPI